MKRNTFLTPLVISSLILILGLILLSRPKGLQAQESDLQVAAAVSTAFTYQGRLTDSGSPANGTYDFRFFLYNAAAGGAQVGSQINKNDVAVVDGLFTTSLDFGNVFNGSARWLEIAVRPGNSNGGYTTLSPRQPLTAIPYALRAKLADNSLGTLSCTTDQIAQFNGSSWVCADDPSAALAARVTALENLLAHVSRNGNDLYITGANLHVVNGTGTTDGTPNSLGNVIIGYNELRVSGDDRSGSHMLVVGQRHNYSSYGGIVAGVWNETSGAYASVSGGRNNTASAFYASVSGGSGNTASGNSASVSGGANSTASGASASISGGSGNTASGTAASISGGYINTASGGGSSVSGGHINTTNGGYSSVSGGSNNTANGDDSSVSGGYQNTARNYYTSVSGGAYNTASGRYASVSGGANNRAVGESSSVSGGANNQAGGRWSTVSGGISRSVSGESDWRAGTLFETQ